MRALILILVVVAAVFAACGTAPSLDTETFTLSHIKAEQAAILVMPYVFTDRPNAPGSVSHSGSMLTVRETRDNLDKIRRVLSEIDRPSPTVRLHFQLIEADGAGKADPAIAAVETELRKLFRFQGYRLLYEAVVGGTEGSYIEQVVGPEDSASGYLLSANIVQIRATGDSGTVALEVGVRNPLRGALMTSVNARAGQTLVVGNAQIIQGGGTLILTVRPEIVR
ncbi:MAG: hypothetical protein E4H37_06495 [Gemmatimonadales bacterium]|nr:MAG: hypothetical protein E4H37_06495 [Gemmatimonadales bacterium]